MGHRPIGMRAEGGLQSSGIIMIHSNCEGLGHRKKGRWPVAVSGVFGKA